MIGWAGHAAAYRLDGKGLSDVVADSGAQAVTLTDASAAVEEGRLLLRFTRPLAAGRVQLDSDARPAGLIARLPRRAAGPSRRAAL